MYKNRKDSNMNAVSRSLQVVLSVFVAVAVFIGGMFATGGVANAQVQTHREVSAQQAVPESDVQLEIDGTSQQTVVFEQTNDVNDTRPTVAFSITTSLPLDIRIAHPLLLDGIVQASSCSIYVPDNMKDQYPSAILFSEVKDWSRMMGATPNDTWTQTICRNLMGKGWVSGFYDVNGHAEMYIAVYEGEPLPTATPSPTVTATVTVTPIITPTSTPTNTPTASPEPTETPTPEPTTGTPVDPREDVDGEITLIKGEPKTQDVSLTSKGGDLQGTLKVLGNGKFTIRVAHGQKLTVYNANGVYNCNVYVPDALVGEAFPNAVPFSQVTNWTFENMLGAQATDSWAQTICRDVTDFPLYFVSDTTLFPVTYVPFVEPTPVPTPMEKIHTFLPKVEVTDINPRYDPDLEALLPNGNAFNVYQMPSKGFDHIATLVLIGEGKYSLRVSHNKPLLVQNQSGLVSCTTYVPDALIGDWPGAIRFSEVTKWGYEDMLGASSSDEWPQTICWKVAVPIFLSSDMDSFAVTTVEE